MSEIPPSKEVLRETLKGHNIPMMIFTQRVENDVPFLFTCRDCGFEAHTPEAMHGGHVYQILAAAGWVNAMGYDIVEMCKP